MQGLVIFSVRVAVGHHAATRLDVHDPVLETGGAEHDAGVHGSIGAEISHRPGVGDAALFELEFVDDLHGAHLRGAREGPGGQGGHQDVHGVQALGRIPLHVGHQVHDVAVALDEEAVGHPHVRTRRALDGRIGAGRVQHGHSPHVVAAEVQEHEVLGPFLGVGAQFGLQGLVLLRRGAPWPGSGDGADGDLAISQAHQDLRRRARQLEVAEVQVE